MNQAATFTGDSGRDHIRNNDLGACAPQTGGTRRFSAFVVLGLSEQDFVEWGWYKIGDGPGGLYTDYWRGFWEYAHQGVVQSVRYFGSDCSANSNLTPNHWARFKTYWASPQPYPYQWNFYYDDNNDGIYECFVGKFTSVHFNYGLALGETGQQFGGDDQNLYDHFADMKHTFQPDNQGWTDWPGNVTWNGCIPPWGRHWLAQNSWEITTGYPCT